MFPTEFIKISKFITSWKGHTSEYIYNWTSNPFPGLFFVKNKKCIGNKFKNINNKNDWKQIFSPIFLRMSPMLTISMPGTKNGIFSLSHFFPKKMNRIDIPEWRCHRRGMWASPSVDHCGGCSCSWQCMSHSPQGLPA